MPISFNSKDNVKSGMNFNVDVNDQGKVTLSWKWRHQNYLGNHFNIPLVYNGESPYVEANVQIKDDFVFTKSVQIGSITF